MTDPQHLNRYSYVRNNPLRYVDPTGRCDIACQVAEVNGAFLQALSDQGTTVADVTAPPTTVADAQFQAQVLDRANAAAVNSYNLFNPATSRSIFTPAVPLLIVRSTEAEAPYGGFVGGIEGTEGPRVSASVTVTTNPKANLVTVSASISFSDNAKPEKPPVGAVTISGTGFDPITRVPTPSPVPTLPSQTFAATFSFNRTVAIPQEVQLNIQPFEFQSHSFPSGFKFNLTNGSVFVQNPGFLPNRPVSFQIPSSALVVIFSDA